MAHKEHRDRSPRSAWSRLSLFLETIKFEHSVFALPFAVLTAFQVSGGVPPWRPLLWIAVAMVSVRTFGMGANRLIDAEIDARNPRTAGRALPAGLITRREVWAYLVVSAGVFAIAVSRLERLAWYLSPIVVAVMVLYPYAKRFTWLSHFGLGAVYVIVPPATWIAMTGEIHVPAGVMGIAAAFWVVGFDVIYATQDVDVDRAQGLHSIPARFGISRGLQIARTFHAITVAGLVAVGLMMHVGPYYWAGVGLAALLLAYEHRLVSPRDLSRLNAAFFTMNGVIAVVFAIFASLDAALA